MNALKDRIVVVTGASRGIGRAASLALSRAGAVVVGVARARGALDELQAAAGDHGGHIETLTIELSDASGAAQLADHVARRYGRLDGLFGNAGVLGPKEPIGALSPATWAEVVDVNLSANFRLLHHLDPLLRASDAGRALFVTSGVAWKRYANWAPYAVTKAALEALVSVYAAEVSGTTVRANLISPGPIRTDLRAEAWPGEDPATVPTPEDLAPAILDLLSPSFTENGIIYDWKERAVTRHRPPG
jgi:NAD(P)-dependent dehydrogenase (short-subunit alcohol dehydrogenase family)